MLPCVFLNLTSCISQILQVVFLRYCHVYFPDARDGTSKIAQWSWRGQATTRGAFPPAPTLAPCITGVCWTSSPSSSWWTPSSSPSGLCTSPFSSFMSWHAGGWARRQCLFLPFTSVKCIYAAPTVLFLLVLLKSKLPTSIYMWAHVVQFYIFTSCYSCLWFLRVQCQPSYWAHLYTLRIGRTGSSISYQGSLIFLKGLLELSPPIGISFIFLDL